MRVLVLIFVFACVLPTQVSGGEAKLPQNWEAINGSCVSKLVLHEDSHIDSSTIRFVCSYSVAGENLNRHAQRQGLSMEMTNGMCFNTSDFMKVFTENQNEIPLNGCFVNLGKGDRSHSLLSFEMDLQEVMRNREIFLCIDPPGEHTKLVIFSIKTKTIQKYLKQAA